MVFRSEENTNFEVEMEKYRNERGRGYSMNSMDYDPQAPKRELIKNAMEVELSEEQWHRIQSAVIGEFR